METICDTYCYQSDHVVKLKSKSSATRTKLLLVIIRSSLMTLWFSIYGVLVILTELPLFYVI